MTSQEAMIFQLKKLKGRPFRDIMIHIFTYFWVPIVIVAAVLGLLVSVIVTRVTQKAPALTVCCINAVAQHEDTATYGEQFAEKAGIDLSEYEITILTNLNANDSDALTAYQSTQILMAMVAAESLDVIAADQETALQCMYADYCADLSRLLSDTQMAQ